MNRENDAIKICKTALCLLAVFTFAAGEALAASSIQGLAVSPGTVMTGQNVTITFRFMGTNNGCRTAYSGSNKSYAAVDFADFNDICAKLVQK